MVVINVVVVVAFVVVTLIMMVDFVFRKAHTAWRISIAWVTAFANNNLRNMMIKWLLIISKCFIVSTYREIVCPLLLPTVL